MKLKYGALLPKKDVNFLPDEKMIAFLKLIQKLIKLSEI